MGRLTGGMKSDRQLLAVEEARSLARVLKALGHPLRVQILRVLQQGDTCLCEMHPFFRLNRSNLCRHVGLLRQAGILTERRAGSRVILHLAMPGILKAVDAAREVARAEAASRTKAIGTATQSPSGRP